jgi:hypothetical protein
VRWVGQHANRRSRAGDRGHARPGLAVDSHGDLAIADYTNNAVREVDSKGRIRLSVVAGTGRAGYSGDNRPATAARLSQLTGCSGLFSRVSTTSPFTAATCISQTVDDPAS